jgi:glycine cleavage system H protein
MYPSDLKYTRDHEWLRLDGQEALVGITHFAQEQLGDVVFVELPEVGRRVRQGEAFGNVESVKAVSELFSPISGEITAVNTTLAKEPELVNREPHTTWVIRLRPSQPAEGDALLDAAAYEALLQQQGS